MIDAAISAFDWTAVEAQLDARGMALDSLHVVRHGRRQGPHRRDLGRRALLRTAAFTGAAGAGYLLLEGVGRSPRIYRKEAVAVSVPTCFTMAWTRPSS